MIRTPASSRHVPPYCDLVAMRAMRNERATSVINRHSHETNPPVKALKGRTEQAHLMDESRRHVCRPASRRDETNHHMVTRRANPSSKNIATPRLEQRPEPRSFAHHYGVRRGDAAASANRSLRVYAPLAWGVLSHVRRAQVDHARSPRAHAPHAHDARPVLAL